MYSREEERERDLLKVRGRVGMVELPPVVRETDLAGEGLEPKSVILKLRGHTVQWNIWSTMSSPTVKNLW